MLIGVLGAFAIVGVLAFLVGRSVSDDPPGSSISESSPVRTLPIRGVKDFDPEGSDGTENPELTSLAIDGDLATGWRTTTYFNRSDLGGLKSGVGLIVDLGGVRQVTSVRVRLAGQPTDLSILAAPRSATRFPKDLTGLESVAAVNESGEDATLGLSGEVLTRYVVVWLRSVPEVDPERFAGEIREISVRGRS